MGEAETDSPRSSPPSTSGPLIFLFGEAVLSFGFLISQFCGDFVEKAHLPCFCIFSAWLATFVLYPSSGTFLPFFCYLLPHNKLPKNLVAWAVISYFSQLWVGSSPLGLAGLTLVAALSSWWGREVRESLTPMLRVSGLAVLLHVASYPPGGQIQLLHSVMVSGFPEL